MTHTGRTLLSITLFRANENGADTCKPLPLAPTVLQAKILQFNLIYLQHLFPHSGRVSLWCFFFPLLPGHNTSFLSVCICCLDCLFGFLLLGKPCLLLFSCPNLYLFIFSFLMVCLCARDGIINHCVVWVGSFWHMNLNFTDTQAKYV